MLLYLSSVTPYSPLCSLLSPFLNLPGTVGGGMLVVLSGSKVGTVGSVSIIDTQLRLVNVTANNNTAGPWLSFGVLTSVACHAVGQHGAE